MRWGGWDGPIPRQPAFVVRSCVDVAARLAAEDAGHRFGDVAAVSEPDFALRARTRHG